MGLAQSYQRTRREVHARGYRRRARPSARTGQRRRAPGRAAARESDSEDESTPVPLSLRTQQRSRTHPDGSDRVAQARQAGVQDRAFSPRRDGRQEGLAGEQARGQPLASDGEASQERRTDLDAGARVAPAAVLLHAWEARGTGLREEGEGLAGRADDGTAAPGDGAGDGGRRRLVRLTAGQACDEDCEKAGEQQEAVLLRSGRLEGAGGAGAAGKGQRRGRARAGRRRPQSSCCPSVRRPLAADPGRRRRPPPPQQEVPQLVILLGGPQLNCPSAVRPVLGFTETGRLAAAQQSRLAPPTPSRPPPGPPAHDDRLPAIAPRSTSCPS